MNNSRRTIAAGRFKAECLGILDLVARTGEVVVVTKRGRPVAKLVPIDPPAEAPLKGSVTYHGDIVAPLDEPWDADR